MAPTGKMPEFLSGCEEYVRYLQLAPEMKLPEYEQDEDGDILVYTGEMYCRVRNCPRAKVSETDNHFLRYLSSTY
jgi:hypothetical protein